MGWTDFARPPRVDYDVFFKSIPEPLPPGPDKTVEDHYPRYASNVATVDLPFIASESVEQRDGKDGAKLWIVIDNVVYDCSEFVAVHPGGDTVIRSFGGQDCSWQFWRLHGERHLRNLGLPLRVGRTEGVGNRFKEPKKYIGLKAMGEDDW